MLRINQRLALTLVLLLSVASIASGALSAAAVWEVRTTGSNTNGGCYVSGGTDWSQQAAAQYAVTDGIAAGTTSISSVTANWGTDVIGNCIYIAGGTGVIVGDWYQVISRTSALIIVVDRATGLTAGTGVTLNLGGAILDPAITCGKAVANNVVFWKTGTYSITSATINVAGGTCQTTANPVHLCGYNTNRNCGNADTGPTYQTNVNTATQAFGALSEDTFYNIIFDGNTGGGFTGSKFSAGGTFVNCTIKNFNTAASGTIMLIGALITGNSASVTSSFGSIGIVAYSEAYANTATPITVGIISNVLSYGNTGATTDGAAMVGTGIGAYVDHFTSVGNGRHGLNMTSSAEKIINNSYFQSNVGTGLICATGQCYGFNNGFFGNGTASSGTLTSFGTITVTADAFTNTAGNVYTLNNLAGAGAALRAIALPLLYPRGLTANISSIGAAQLTSQGPVAFGGQ